MSDKLINRYVATRIRVQNALDSGERGQGSLEYIGMIVVAAVLIVAVLTAFKGADFGAKIQSAIDNIKSNMP